MNTKKKTCNYYVLCDNESRSCYGRDSCEIEKRLL